MKQKKEIKSTEDGKRGYKRIKPYPKNGKYLYEYVYKIGMKGFPESFIGKNKYYIVYKRGAKIYYVAKGDKACCIRNIREDSLYDLKKDREEIYKKMNEDFKKKSFYSSYHIPYNMKVYSYYNICHTGAISLLESQKDMFLLDNLKEEYSDIINKINKENKEFESKIARLQREKEALSKKILRIEEKEKSKNGEID